MAGKKGHGTFKPGQSGNPSGRPKKDEFVKKFQETSYIDFIRQLHKYGLYTKQQMYDELHRPEATMFEIMFATIVSRASAGDKDARKELLDRLWGKVKYAEELSPSNEPSNKPQIVITLPDNGRSAV